MWMAFFFLVLFHPYETISCLCVLQQSVVRFTTKQRIALLLLLLFLFYFLFEKYI